jgi:hypothetical protein
MPSTELTMTHEAIADALGVARGSPAACKLRRQGAIRYQRGHIEVLDRASRNRTGEFYQHGNGRRPTSCRRALSGFAARCSAALRYISRSLCRPRSCSCACAPICVTNADALSTL